MLKLLFCLLEFSEPSTDLSFIYLCLISFMFWLPGFRSVFWRSIPVDEDIFTSTDNFFFVFNTFQNKPWFLRVSNKSLLKTLWEKEKLLIMSNFSFSHSVFYTFGILSAFFSKSKTVICKRLYFGRVQNLSFGKG